MLFEYANERVKGIKESFDNAMALAIDAYRDNRIVDLYPTTEVFEIYTSTEGMSGAKNLAAAEKPPVLTMNDGYSVMIYEQRFGGGIELLEAEYKREANDVTTKVDAVLIRKRNHLLIANKQLFLDNMFQFLNYAFATTYYAAPDGAALCGTHTWNTPGAPTFANNGTAALSVSAIDALDEYGGAFVDSTNHPMPMDFDTIVVKKGSANARWAKRIFAEGISPIAVADINIYEGTKTIIETPYITSANKNYWFAIASKDPNGNPLKMGIGLYPTLNEPIRELNEAILTNCTGFWKQGIVNMPYAFYGSNGTT
jgi:hypothetical protein